MPALRIAALLAVIGPYAAAPAAAQVPPETHIYDLINIVPPPPPVACACVSGAFALPALRPGHGWGVGPGTPLKDAPMSDASREIYATRRAEDRAQLPVDAADGLGGNAHASVAVAMLLREASIAAGGDKATEEEVGKWLHLAAAQEHPDAFRLLGYRYQRGEGIPQSDRAAAFFFHQGALRRDAISMVALGLRYATGRGVPQDFGAAVHWWRRADHMLASRFLGDAYACGLGVDQNPDAAVRAYSKAADAGDPARSIQLGRLYLGGCVAPNPSRAPATHDQIAFKALYRAASDGFPDAQIMLSDLLLEGRGADMNPQEAYYWARLAERRLESGDLQARARAVAAAARLMSPEERAAAEEVVTAMIMTKPLQ